MTETPEAAKRVSAALKRLFTGGQRSGTERSENVVLVTKNVNYKKYKVAFPLKSELLMLQLKN